MEIYKAIILGAIQGLTEFLPISSSGHLALATAILGADGGIAFGVLMHFATLLPVCMVFRKEILTAIKNKEFIKNLIIATIPAGVVGLLFSEQIEVLFLNPKKLAWSFLVTALALILSQSLVKRADKTINKRSALVYGLFQAVAVVPGISRSGACITAGRVCKIDDSENLPFAFIMSIPIILASTVLEGAKLVCLGDCSIGFFALAFGFLSALVFGFISARFMKKLSKKSNYGFSVYLVVLSLILFVC